MGIKFAPILNYIKYIKEDAKSVISNELDWKDYGGKHFESIFTRFHQAYILPRKFGIDKRKSHYSTLICSGQLSKQKALELMQLDIYDKDKLENDKSYVIKKLGLTEEEFERIINTRARNHTHYGSYMNYYRMLRPIIKKIKKLYSCSS
ncbi:MAG: hypothetical protein JKY33_07290 [Bacteroidia bacterium]|nr:hypothetical protein [Bacteroidia bacterium]